MRLLWVMTMNCVFSDISAIFAANRPTLASSSGASTSSKQAERRRTVFEDREHESDGGHRLFAAGKQQNILQPFARRLGDDLDAGLENVVGLEQCHLAAAAAEQFLEKLDEMFIDRLECRSELLA